MNRFSIAVSVLSAAIVIAAGCTPMVSNVQTTPETPKKVPLRELPEPQKESARLTILDTINNGNEIFLDEKEFTTPRPAVQPVQQPLTSSEQPALRYRIQIVASSQASAIESGKKDFKVKSSLPTYTAFESPYYKLYAGDFLTREEAERTLTQLKKIGYNDAWIVRTKSLSR